MLKLDNTIKPHIVSFLGIIFVNITFLIWLSKVEQTVIVASARKLKINSHFDTIGQTLISYFISFQVIFEGHNIN